MGLTWAIHCPDAPYRSRELALAAGLIGMAMRAPCSLDPLSDSCSPSEREERRPESDRAMDDAIKLIFDVAAFASIMVLVVSGLAVIASLMGIFNLGHGEFVLLGAYTVFLFGRWGLPTWLGMLVAPVAVGLFGAAIERTVIRRLYAQPVIAMLATYAIGLIIREIVRGLIGGQYYAIAEPLPGAFEIGGVSFSIWRAVIIGATLAIMVLAWLFLTLSLIHI